MMTSLRIVNASSRPTAIVEEVVEFAIASAPLIRGSVAVRAYDGRYHGGTGRAADRHQHGIQKWAGRARFSIALGIPTDDRFRPGPRVSGYASAMRTSEMLTVGPDGIQAREHVIGEALAAGRSIGRWPVYEVRDWVDDLVHLAAHEAYHVVQFQRDRQSTSEVACEIFACGVLSDWRARETEDVVEAAARVAEGRA